MLDICSFSFSIKCIFNSFIVLLEDIRETSFFAPLSVILFPLKSILSFNASTSTIAVDGGTVLIAKTASTVGYFDTSAVAPVSATTRLNYNGPFYVQALTATTDVNALSDNRLKDNIEIITNALEKIKQIRGVTYTRNDLDIDRRFAGVIAQEVETVLPEVITTMDDGTKTVAYGNLISLLIEAIKEQQKQIEELKQLIKK